MDLYHYSEFALVSVLFFRMLYFLCLDRSLLLKNLELVIYFLVLFLNSLLHEIGLNESVINRLYNIVLPLSLIVSLGFEGSKKPLFTLMIILMGNFFFINFYNIKIVSILYVVSIFMVILKAINMTGKSSRILRSSPLYLVLAIDLIFTIVSLELSQFSVDWSLSKYINNVQSISLAVFFIDVVLYHVYIRRFFII
jgi:hypothetical protein